MDTFILSTAATFLQAKDACSMLQVCKSWNEHLAMESSSQNVWRSIWRNTYPTIAKCLLVVVDDEDDRSAATNEKEWDFPKLIRWMRQCQMPTYFNDREDDVLPLNVPPTLQLKDVSCIVEIYQDEDDDEEEEDEDSVKKRKSLGFVATSNIQNGQHFFCHQPGSTGIILRGANPYYQYTDIQGKGTTTTTTTKTPKNNLRSTLFWSAYRDALGILNLEEPHYRRLPSHVGRTLQHTKYKVCLVRRDTQQRVCIMDEGLLEQGDPIYQPSQPVGQGDYGNIRSRYTAYKDTGYWKIDLSRLNDAMASSSTAAIDNDRPTKNNTETKRSQTRRTSLQRVFHISEVDSSSSIARLYTAATFNVHLMVGTDTNDNNPPPEWLQKLQSNELQPNDEELTSIPYFEFEIRDFGLTLEAQPDISRDVRDGNNTVNDRNEIQLVLDALPWE